MKRYKRIELARMQILYATGCITQQELVKLFGGSQAAVSKALKRKV